MMPIFGGMLCLLALLVLAIGASAWSMPAGVWLVPCGAALLGTGILLVWRGVRAGGA